ncbi:RNA polymerase sigma factor [Actinomadura kijaniata]|uniref:RNA polymerase sigma factor n=1 Tax=Actinomadura kijaniata TaxID=46161 RepID=UPI003F1A37E6
MGTQDDDSARFTRLYDQWYGHVLAYARRRVQEHTARDVTAETFLVAWRRLDEVPDDPLPWLYGVARRVLANETRRAARADRLAGKVARQPVQHGPDAAERVTGVIDDVLTALPEADRELLRLLAWEDLSTAQAAKVLGCRPATLAVRLHRARRRLRALLDQRAGSRPSPFPESSKVS